MIDIGHTRSCATWDGSTDQLACTCCLQVRIALSTEQTMHAAWRKRAEEAEAERDAALARIELLEHDMKTGDYETLYAQVVVELAAMTAERDATLAENAILARYRLSLSDALAERDAALAGMEKQADFIVALADRIDSVEAEALKLRADLAAAQKVPT